MKTHGTAKGGALSKKDFGVAFGGGAPAVCNFDYDYNCGTDSAGIGGSYGQYAIRNVTGTATTVATADWYLLKRVGTIDPATAQLHMYESDGTTKTASSNSVDVSGVTSTGIGEPITFTFSPAVEWSDDYYLAIEYGPGGTASQPLGLGIPNSYTTTGSCTTPTDITCHYWVNATSSWATMFDQVSLFINCVTSCT